MRDGLRINRVKYNKWTTEEVDINSANIPYRGATPEKASDTEARLWLDAVANDKEVVVKPEQAIVVTRILDAIYRSGKTGKPVFFDENGLPME